MDACPPSQPYVGWHFSYAFSTPVILNKLRSFKHAAFPFLVKLLHQPEEQARAYVDACVSQCLDIIKGRKNSTMGVVRNAFDDVLPPLLGWPRHPLAP